MTRPIEELGIVATLLAAIDKIQAPKPEHQFLVAVALVVLVAIGIAVVARMKREAQDEEPASEEDMLKEFERAYFAGEIDKAEFERICASLKRKGPKPMAPQAVEPPPSAAAPAAEPEEPLPEPPPPVEEP